MAASSPDSTPLDRRQLLHRLGEASAELEATQRWPVRQLNWLAGAGVLRRGIPAEFGGVDQSPRELLQDYIELADACLVTTFVLTQRQAAVQRIIASANDQLRHVWLPRLANGDAFATVGISHLTTSRQHLAKPAVAVEHIGDELQIHGEVPWVTGGAQADLIVTGGVDPHGRQVLVALPADITGVSCDPPERLLALSASGTSRVRLEGVRLPATCLLAGPEDRVVQNGAGAGTGSLGTSALAAGLAKRAVRLLEGEALRRSELQAVAVGFRREVELLIDGLLSAADGAGPGVCGTPESLRERANSVALRSTQALLAASKGAGFVQGHPAERAVREALFFLVWSCPQPVVAAALRGFACLAG